MSDIFRTISTDGKGQYTEQRSRFLSFAHHCTTIEQAKNIIAGYARDYHDARHVCWAYRIGSDDSEQSASSDNGEPSGTAGRPILGQIRSADLTDITIIVVRYFGGIKLGTSGLITAYKEAAELAIESAEKITGYRKGTIEIAYPYMAMNDVMKIVKGSRDIEILEQTFDNTCKLLLSIRLDEVEAVRNRLIDIDGVTTQS